MVFAVSTPALCYLSKSDLMVRRLLNLGARLRTTLAASEKA